MNRLPTTPSRWDDVKRLLRLQRFNRFLNNGVIVLGCVAIVLLGIFYIYAIGVI